MSRPEYAFWRKSSARNCLSGIAAGWNRARPVYVCSPMRNKYVRSSRKPLQPSKRTETLRAACASERWSTMAGLRVPGLVAKYTQKYPRVELAITTGTTAGLTNEVVEHRLDGAFVAGPVNHQDLREEPFFLEQLVLVTPLAVRNLFDLANIENLKVIMFREGCSYRDRLSSILGGLGVPYRVMEFASLDAIITCITAGVGVTLLPKELVDDIWRTQSVAVHELPDQALVETVFVQRRDHHPTSALNAFLQMSLLLRAGTVSSCRVGCPSVLRPICH